MLRIYLTRHGETKWNKEGRMQGWKNSDLTEKGIEDAIKLGEALRNTNLTRIYCSPLKRAKDTAKYIKGNREIDIIEKEKFKEMNFGEWEGCTSEDIIKDYKEEYDNFWNRPDKFKSIGGEEYSDFIDRVYHGFEEVIKNEKDGEVLIVAHGVVVKGIIAKAINRELKDYWSGNFIHGTSLTVFEVEDDRVTMIKEADISHIK